MRGSSFRLTLATACVVAGCSSDSAPSRTTDAGASLGGGPSAGGQTATTSGGASSSGGGLSAGASNGGASNGGGGTSGGANGGSSGANGSGDGGVKGEGGAVAACPASDAGNTADGTDVFKPNTVGSKVTAVPALTYTNVGKAGAYAEVVSGWSKATGCVGDPSGNLCKTEYRKEKQVSGPLAPFNEEMSFVFAGPIELYQIAVYAPSGGAWTRQAYWDRCTTDGLAFAGNKSWYECNGFVESYVTADGTKESQTPMQFAGTVAAGTEVHVHSSALCSGSTAASECGWSSGLPIHGFGGDAAGSKIFAAKLRMPIGDKTPAYWILPTQVIRSSQYGCNCRGQGSDPKYKGGCGELDVAEILGGNTTSLEATTTLYSFQDIDGGGLSVFNRPVHESAVFLVIFDAPSRQIAIRRLGPSEFDFGASLPAAAVSALLASPGETRALD